MDETYFSSVLLQGCGICKDVMSCWNFSPSVRKPGTLGQWCIECQHNYSKEWRKKKRKSKPRIYEICQSRICDSSLLHLNKDAKYCSKYCKDKEWTEQRREYKRDYARKLKYGISKEEFIELWNLQSGKCAICFREFNSEDKRTVHIDHDHFCCPPGGSCGNCVRGLLCMNCNLLLGYTGDSVELLQIAIDYLNGR